MGDAMRTAAAERGRERGLEWARAVARPDEVDALAVLAAGDRARLRLTLEHWPTLYHEARRWGLPASIDGTVDCRLDDEFVRAFVAGALEPPDTNGEAAPRCAECGQPLAATRRVA
jgi:hypothetical protein